MANKLFNHKTIRCESITSHGGFISEAVEGAAAQLAGTVAFNSDDLDLVDCCSVTGPRSKGEDLRKRGSEWGVFDDGDSAGQNVQYLLLPPSANTI